MNYAGFDTARYVGRENAADLKAKTNFQFMAFYLGPAPCHPETDYMAARNELKAQGWGLLPIFVGRQLDEALAGGGEVIDPSLPSEDGAQDGALAGKLMGAAGFPAGSWVYLDVENGPPLTAVLRMYVTAWVRAVKKAGYQPGVYCSHLLADPISQTVPGTRIWTVKVATTQKHPASRYGNTFPTPDPHAGGFQFAYVWQHEQEAVINVDGLILEVDLDVAMTRDPSAP